MSFQFGHEDPSSLASAPVSASAMGSGVSAGLGRKVGTGTKAAGATAGRFALVHGVGPGAMAHIAWERVVRRRKVLVSIGEPPPRLTVAQKLFLSFAEGVLASPDILGALGELDIAASRVVTLGEPADRSTFMACPRTRAGATATRIAYVGELSPRSGVADFLACAIVWAELHPARAVEICWAGRGDLEGVLRAQLLPTNLAQSFTDPAGPGALARLFAQSGLLVVPSLSRVRAPCVAEAMAAGLPVLGSVRSTQVRGLVAEPETGWLFDPLLPERMYAALDAALATDPARLDAMRAAARARIAALHSERRGEGVDQTLWALLPDLVASSRPARA